MMITQQKSEVNLLGKQDTEFYITEGITVYSRASISFSKSMPAQYQQMVLLCLQNDWIKLVACVRDSELAAGKMWNKLKTTGE